MSGENSEFDWMDDSDTRSAEPDVEQSLEAVEQVREQVAELRRECYHLRRRTEDLKHSDSESEARVGLVIAEDEEVLEMQEHALEYYDALAQQYDGGVPRRMLIGTILNNHDWQREKVERALLGLVNTGRFVENKGHLKRPSEDV